MEKVVDKRDLMTLINEIQDNGIDSFTVHEPFFGGKMLDIAILDDGYEIELSGKDEFGSCPSKEKYWDRDDIPDFYDYKECLISSGLVKFDNWNDFVDWIEYLYRSEIDPTLSSKSVFLSIDTNMAYYRMISRRFPIKTDKNVIPASDFDYLLSSIVEGEIDHRIKDKYDNSDLKMMGLHTQIGDLRFNFRNRGKLRTRKAKFATEELNYLRGELNAARVSGNPSKKDSEKNDIRIVDSLEKFSWSKNISVALLSSDRNMGNHAENSEVPYFIFEMPSSVSSRHEVGPDILLNLLHDLALTFGAVKLPELETTLFGIWGGKRDLDYRSEAVKLWMNPNSSLKDGFKRDLEVIDSIEEGM